MTNKSLEMEGKLRLLRTANDQDAVTVVPRDPFMILPADMGCICWFLCCTQHAIYRHVGMGLKLYSKEGSHHELFHAKCQTHFLRTWLSDFSKTFVRLFYVLIKLICFVDTCCRESYRMNHGYPEYTTRVKMTAKSELGTYTLDELYEQFNKGDYSNVKSHYW